MTKSLRRHSAPGPGKAEEIVVDIYILFEHKSYRDEAILIQLLCYMYLMWQKDFDAKRPLRVIVPVVFYHGKAKWNIPRNFNEQFDVSDEMRSFYSITGIYCSIPRIGIFKMSGMRS